MLLRLFQGIHKRRWRELIEGNMETLKNYSNHSSESNIRDDCGAFMADTYVFVTFNILVVLISLLIVSASSLVIYQITISKTKKVRYDVAFISISVSDIGVALFSVPLLGIQQYYHGSCGSSPLIARLAFSFFSFFPYSFSCLFTSFIAVDRMFAITLAQKYTNFITQKIFKVIAITLFLISVTSASILTMPKKYITIWVYYCAEFVVIILGVLIVVVVILAHLHILHFATRRKDLKKLRKHNGKNFNGKRLTNTIICICISKLICFFPYLPFRLLQLRGHMSFKLYEDIRPWVVLLVYCQCFCNSLIILHNKKSKKISK